MKIFNFLSLLFCFVVIAFMAEAQKIKKEKVSTTYLKYPKVQVNSLQGLVLKAAKSGNFIVGKPVLKDTKSQCVAKGGGLKDVMEIPTYYYEIPMKNPSMIVSVKNASGEVIFADEVLQAENEPSLFGYDQCNNWMQSSLEKKWAEEGETFLANDNKLRIENAIDGANSKIKSDLFYELAKEDLEVNWYKDKDYNYDDLERAAQLAVAGYENFNEQYNSEQGKSKLSEAVDIWLKAVKEVDPDDKNARINKKVAKDLYQDMAIALMYLERFDEATEAIKAARDLTSANMSTPATQAQEALYKRIMERKIDAEKFSGKAVVYAPENIQINLVDDAQYASLSSELSSYKSSTRGAEFATDIAIYQAEKQKLDEAIASGEVNPYEHMMTKTSIQGYMLMLYNKEEFPVEVTELTQLNQLYISNGKIATIPKEIVALENLQLLNLANNQLTSLPEEMGELKNLKKLNVKGNDIPESEIQALQAKLSKCKIKF